MTDRTDWPAVIAGLCPGARRSIAEGLAAAMPALVASAGLTSRLRQAHFLAQVAHESDGLSTAVEYASGAAYEGRRDLGNTQRGDGRRFKGRGLIQLTGRANYAAAGKALGLDLVADPKAAAAFPAAALVAGWFWTARGCNAAADADDIVRVTRIVNGGTNGLDDRRRYLAKAKRALGLSTPASPARGIADLPASDADAPEPDPPGERLVAFAQERLRALGYFEVGEADGMLGSRTRGALLAFKADQGLPLTPAIDDATLKALASAGPRTVPPERAQATARDLASRSAIVRHAAWGKAWAWLQGAVAGLWALVAGVAGQLGDATGKLAPVKEMLGEVPAWAWALGALAVAVALWMNAAAIERRRVEDYRSGKVP